MRRVDPTVCYSPALGTLHITSATADGPEWVSRPASGSMEEKWAPSLEGAVASVSGPGHRQADRSLGPVQALSLLMYPLCLSSQSFVGQFRPNLSQTTFTAFLSKVLPSLLPHRIRAMLTFPDSKPHPLATASDSPIHFLNSVFPRAMSEVSLPWESPSLVPPAASSTLKS